MRAAVLHGPRDLRVEAIPVPTIEAGELLLRVTGAGVCGSDAALFVAGQDAIPARESGTFPVVLGHEFAGLVVEAAPDTGFEVGELVASGAGVSCGHCDRCLQGRTNLCRNYRTAGVFRHGGLAEYVAIPASTCVRAADHGVTGDDAALAQPMAIACHALRRAGVREGERVLVIGIGGVGAFVVWAASRMGAEVTACDTLDERLELARDLGAFEVVKAGPGAAIEAQLDDRPPWDVALEASGSEPGFRAAFSLLDRGGRMVIVGTQKKPLEVDLMAITRGEVDLLGTHAHVCGEDLPTALDMLAARGVGWADVAPTAIALEDVVEDALLPLLEGRSTQIKSLIDPAVAEPRPYNSRTERSVHS
jgi:(R,R)-butanediol dehydrogenase/meso-butanediol dehydrogenase/diacetyl reductase